MKSIKRIIALVTMLAVLCSAIPLSALADETESGLNRGAATLTGLRIDTASNKVEYLVGEKFDPAGMAVFAVYSDNSSTEISGYTFPDVQLTLADTSVTISYTEGDVTVTAAQAITVTEPATVATLTGLRIDTVPNKTEYLVGEKFDPEGMVVSALYSNDSSAEISGYTFPDAQLTLADTSVTISYTEGDVTVTATQAITVTEPAPVVTLTGLRIDTAPNKTEYLVGEKFDPAGMIVSALYSDGSNAAVSGYTYPDVQLTLADTSVTISYNEGDVTVTAAQAITVTEPAAVVTLTGLRIDKSPNKTKYLVGEKFAPAGMVISALYSDGSSAEVSGYTYPDVQLTLTDTSVTISYTDGDVTVTATQAITMSKPIVTLTGLQISRAPDKLSYFVGDKFNTKGLVIKAYYSDGTNKEIKNYTYSPSGALKVSDTVITVSYKEGNATKTATQKIKVVPVTITSIRVTTPPKRTTYVSGQKFNKSGMKVKAYYNNGYSKEVYSYTVLPSAALSTRNTYVRINLKYGSKTFTTVQKIRVVPVALSTVKVIKAPTKRTYVSGQKFNRSGMKVKAYYNNGASKYITNYAVTPKTALTTRNTYVRISYRSGSVVKSTTLKIRVVPVALSSIKITKAPTKRTYVSGQKFNRSGMIVTAYYNNGVKKRVTKYSCSPTRGLSVKDKYITVKYKSGKVTKTAKLKINVQAVRVVKIKVTTKPKRTVYVPKQRFKKDGMVVTAYYNNGAKKVVKNYTLPVPKYKKGDKYVKFAYEFKKGDKYITVAYKEKGVRVTTRLPVTVKNVVPVYSEIAVDWGLNYIGDGIYDNGSEAGAYASSMVLIRDDKGLPNRRYEAWAILYSDGKERWTIDWY